MSNHTQTLTESPTALRNLEALLGIACRQATDPAEPIVRISRMEAILAEVFEKGMAAMAPAARSGQIFQRAA